ncbi:MAG: diguanylate cyclase [Treponema sp.]
MKRSLMLLYAVCATLMIAGSLLWFVFTLRSDSQLGKAEALKSFKGFTKQAADILHEPYIQNDPVRLQMLLEQLCRNHHGHLQTVLIRNETGTVFMWPNNSDIFSYNEQNVVEVKNMPLFLTAAQTHLPVFNDGSRTTVHAALQILSVETVFHRGRTVFILILIIFLMTVTLLIMSYIDMAPAKKSMERFSRTGRKTDTDTDAIPSEPQHDATEDTPAAPVCTANAPEANGITSFSTDLESLDHLHIYNEQSEQAAASDQISESLDELPAHDESVSPADINAEHYGCFENYTQPGKQDASAESIQPVDCLETSVLSETAAPERERFIDELTAAITETAAAEEDLTLLFIRADNLADNERALYAVRTGLDRIHKIFVFDEKTLGLIIFYSPLDRAMQIASQLYDDIYALLDAAQRPSLGIGLTTRAGRLIPAHRMMDEACAAIEKAVEEGSDPIVAFRVNPAKYRRCLARLN